MGCGMQATNHYKAKATDKPQDVVILFSLYITKYRFNPIKDPSVAHGGYEEVITTAEKPQKTSSDGKAHIYDRL